MQKQFEDNGAGDGGGGVEHEEEERGGSKEDKAELSLSLPIATPTMCEHSCNLDIAIHAEHSDPGSTSTRDDVDMAALSPLLFSPSKLESSRKESYFPTTPLFLRVLCSV